eukprot:3695257-Prymnesium_polylepis.1
MAVPSVAATEVTTMSVERRGRYHFAIGPHAVDADMEGKAEVEAGMGGGSMSTQDYALHSYVG